FRQSCNSILRCPSISDGRLSYQFSSDGYIRRSVYAYGEGTIVNMEGSGEHSRLQVAFQGQGIKWLVAAYARLETV
ncbi:hypothetical protein QS493_21795, partial [Escherichia coli]|nr:hypothetical protein [Escherichia coli]